MFEKKPYLLSNTIQKYSWGTKGKSAFIPKLLGISLDKNEPAAELWMGAHPKAPSRIYFIDSWVDLDKIIDEYPEEVLGQKIIQKFGKQLPYLFKLLSANEPLSIQVHPSKSQAEELHKKDPEHYPDENHKPEIAVVLDELKLLIGFKSTKELDELFERFPSFRNFFRLTKAELKNIMLLSEVGQQEFFINLIKKLLDHSIKKSASYFTLVEGLRNKIVNQLEYDDLNESEILFHDLYPKFSNDLGLVLLLMMNLVTLEKGEAFYTPAGIPHAYISGNIIECMANSDNVIRAGLTPKFIDVESLKNVINFSFGIPEKVKTEGDKHHFLYKTPAEEFEIHTMNLSPNQVINYSSSNNPTIGIVMEGIIKINWDENSQEVEFNKGQSFILPSILGECSISSISKSKIFLAGIPELKEF